MTSRGLPFGFQTFRCLHERNCYYVDKTVYVHTNTMANRPPQRKTPASSR